MYRTNRSLQLRQTPPVMAVAKPETLICDHQFRLPIRSRSSAMRRFSRRRAAALCRVLSGGAAARRPAGREL